MTKSHVYFNHCINCLSQSTYICLNAEITYYHLLEFSLEFAAWVRWNMQHIFTTNFHIKQLMFTISRCLNLKTLMFIWSKHLNVWTHYKLYHKISHFSVSFLYRNFVISQKYFCANVKYQFRSDDFKHNCKCVSS